MTKLEEKKLAKENRITIRLNDFERDWVNAGAALSGKSVAEFVRDTVLLEIEEDIMSQMFLSSYSDYEKEKDKYVSLDKYL